MAPPRADLVELRVLDGPNLYFPRPAVKLTIAVGGWVEVPEERLASALERAGATGRPGRPGSDQRRRTVARLAARLTWRLATASRVRLAVRSRPGPEPDQVVVAFPWRRRGAAEALGLEVAPLLHEVGGRRSVDRLLAEAAARVAEVEPGDEPEVTDPDIPVVSITGTNGKTTTVRLLAHIVRSAGKTVAYSSTDGVYRGDGEADRGGRLLGASAARPGRWPERPDVAVLETARGGILLRGIGVLHNDVAVVTQRVRGPPGPPRDRDDRPARGGEGDGHADHAAGGVGRAERRRPAGALDAPAARRAAPGSARSTPGTRRSATPWPTAAARRCRWTAG